jgi:hypothetical protein
MASNRDLSGFRRVLVLPVASALRQHPPPVRPSSTAAAFFFLATANSLTLCFSLLQLAAPFAARPDQIEAAHTGAHGIAQKSSDLSAIPLCVKHHRTGDHSYHKLGPRKFSNVHELNIQAIVARLSSKP